MVHARQKLTHAVRAIVRCQHQHAARRRRNAEYRGERRDIAEAVGVARCTCTRYCRHSMSTQIDLTDTLVALISHQQNAATECNLVQIAEARI